MASLERRYDGRYRIIFSYRGRRLTHSLGKVTERHARCCKDRLEENLQLVGRGRMEVPPDADPGAFLVSDGKLNARPVLDGPVTLGEFFARYRDQRVPGAKEPSTRYIEDIHIAHLTRVLGPRTRVRAVTAAEMQSYVSTRARERGRGGRAVSEATIRKEVGTFAAVWNRWGVPRKLVAGPPPVGELEYPKAGTKPPFQTWEQIERQVRRGGLSPAEVKDLWDSLFLTLPQIEELLEHTRARPHRGYVPVLFALAAYTGVRRSEMLRSRVDDFDLTAETVTVREKKKDRSRELTFRVVPMAPALRAVMGRWLADHPGGRFTFGRTDGRPLGVAMAGKAFRLAVAGSRWEVLRGWHVLRHSFASNCAARGVDQRLVDRWLGHQTEEMRLRYQHLYPDQQREAIRSVFG